MSVTCQTRPAKQSPPEERDWAIFKLAEIHYWTHDKIAQQYDLTRRRVSQIVQEVRHWLSLHPADDPEIASEIQRQRYGRQLERMQLQDIISRAVEGLNSAPPVLVTTRSTDDGPQTRTLRDQPPVDGRLLQTYLRAVTALGKLNERPELPLPPPPPKAEEPWMHAKVQEVIERWRSPSHVYTFSDGCMEKFAEDLTVAFLDYLEEHQSKAVGNEPVAESEAASGASHISLAETLVEAAAAVPPADTTSCAVATSVNEATSSLAANAIQTSCEKMEKGSAEDGSSSGPVEEEGEAEEEMEYAKPLWIGPLPANHPAMRQGPPIRRQASSPQPVVELEIDPSRPGASLHVGSKAAASQASVPP